MRQSFLLLTFVALLCLGMSESAQAVTITKAGPAGMGTTDGSSSLKLWFKSDTQVYSDTAGTIAATGSNPVRRWNNLAGTGLHNAIADVSGREPTYATGLTNGLPGLSFTGGALNTGSRLTVANTSPGAFGFTSYAMTSNETALFALDFTTGAHNGILSDNNTTDNHGWDGGNGSMFESASFSYAQNYFVNGVDTPTTGAGFKVVTGVDNPRAAGNIALRFGSGHGGNNDYGGRLLETIVFNNDLNSAQRIIAENYLSSRYNIGGTVVAVVNQTLGANDNYAGDLASNGNYDFEVFGVGQVDGSNIHTSGGNAGFGLEATSGLGNGEWLMAGHDTTVNSLISINDNNPDTLTQRWNRAWYVDKTGALDATLAFDFEDAGLAAPGPGATFQLLYSADSNFNDGFQTLATTNSITAGTVAFSLANALLLDGYYTLGLSSIVPEPNSLLIMLGVMGCGMLRRRKTLAAQQRG